MDVKQMFNDIAEYHKELGYNNTKHETDEERMATIRTLSFAAIAEIVELTDSLPWKPWRPIQDQPHDLNNAKREIIDIIFFLVEICEKLEISPEELEATFLTVLANNYKRIQNGYSMKGGDV